MAQVQLLGNPLVHAVRVRERDLLGTWYLGGARTARYVFANVSVDVLDKLDIINKETVAGELVGCSSIRIQRADTGSSINSVDTCKVL